MVDSFEVELARLVRVLRGLEIGSDISAAEQLLSQFAGADARRRGVTAFQPVVEEGFLPDALRAVAFDAQAAGVDLACIADAVAHVRRELSGPWLS